MRSKLVLSSPLQAKVIAVPESRQLDVLAALFERRGARVIRVPLVSIHDTPDQAPVIRWLRQFIAEPPNYFIIMTGEGLRRLLAAARRNRLESDFVAALAQVCKICRGPKPGRALKEIQLQADLLGSAPTTAGVITTLRTLDLETSRVAIQLYGEDPNVQLMAYLDTRKLGACLPVAPYVYASDSDNHKVERLIHLLAKGEVDLVAFTSQPQVRRLITLAQEAGLETELRRGLARTKIASVGPLVKDALLAFGCEVNVMPTKSYFMKPLVRAIEDLYSNSVESSLDQAPD
ncbi:MAG: uroporphyrinogen-III synthase [Proteobacteria bacterium]|nr:uroporphyrinogen-III synthase [Pseudomonadota bacterium]